jgi:hypothetical protein
MVFAVQRRAAASEREEALFCDRVEHDARERATLGDDVAIEMVKCGRPFRNAIVPSIGSTTNVFSALRRSMIVDRFLREPAISRPRRRQFRIQIAVDGEIGLGDGLAFALVPMFVRAAEIISRDFARALRGFGDEGEVVTLRQRSCLRRAMSAR